MNKEIYTSTSSIALKNEGRHLFFLLHAILILFIKEGASCQSFNPRCKYTSIGVYVSGSYFDGDIPSTVKMVRPGLGLSFIQRYSPRVSLRADIFAVRIQADDFAGSTLGNKSDEAYYVRNLHFKNDIKGISAGFQYDLFPTTSQSRKRPIYNIFGYAGLNAFYHNPKANFQGKWVSLKPLKTEGRLYSNFQFAIPFGIGIRYKLALQWDLEAEVIYHYTLTDYLDDVSGKYIDFSRLSERGIKLSNRSGEQFSSITGMERDLGKLEELGYTLITEGEYSYFSSTAPGKIRGSKKGNDSYAVFNVRLCYIIPGGKVNCPKFRENY